jgi:DNA-binding CsgD family transcriptional regulator
MEGIDLVTSVRRKRDVNRRARSVCCGNREVVRLFKAERNLLGAVSPRPDLRKPERGKCATVELTTAGEIADANADMVDHYTAPGHSPDSTSDQAPAGSRDVRPGGRRSRRARPPGIDHFQRPVSTWIGNTTALGTPWPSSQTRVLVLTTFEVDEYVFGALDAGASGFLLKSAEPADLVQAIRVVAGGESLLAPGVTRRLIDTYVSRSQASGTIEHDRLAELTPREREVLDLIATGLTNTEIAEALHLSPLTAKTHVSRILMKLGARDRVQLVVSAYQTGIAGDSRRRL